MYICPYLAFENCLEIFAGCSGCPDHAQEELPATVRESTYLGQWLRNRVHKPASAVAGHKHYHSTIIEHSCPLIPLLSGCRNSAQAALDARIMRPEEVRAAVRESADLGQWLGNKVHKLFSTPVEIVAFSDEEGVRWASFLHSSVTLWQAGHLAWVAADLSRRAV